jgi:hypothetical protein
MSYSRFLFCCAVLAVIVGTVTAEDWLGRCEGENNTTTAPNEVPDQACLNPIPCTNRGPAGCGSIVSECTAHPTLKTIAYEERAIDAGDCTTIGSAEGCKECGGNLICFVGYKYQKLDADGCFRRCPIPELHFVQGPAKCVP